jgi:hypothetical protein
MEIIRTSFLRISRSQWSLKGLRELKLGLSGKLDGATTQATIFFSTIPNAIARGTSTFNAKTMMLTFMRWMPTETAPNGTR